MSIVQPQTGNLAPARPLLLRRKWLTLGLGLCLGLSFRFGLCLGTGRGAARLLAGLVLLGKLRVDVPPIKQCWRNPGKGCDSSGLVWEFCINFIKNMSLSMIKWSVFEREYDIISDSK